MSGRVVIYGATGYTGRLLVQRAVARGLEPVVAGRDADKVAALARAHGMEGRTFSVGDVAGLRAGIADAACVINSAGPFVATAEPMMTACIEQGAHYCDMTGEIDVFALAQSLDARAVAAGVMLMPGAGWDVVPSDCLALHTARRVTEPRALRLALRHVGGAPSRGSARTGGVIAAAGLRRRRNGVIESLEGDPPRRDFDFEGTVQTSGLMSMGDIVTAWKSTGIPDIEVYGQMLERMAPLSEDVLATLPDGPSDEQLANWRAFVLAEVDAADGTTVRSLIETGSGYGYTADAGVEVARRAQSGDAPPGFQSPASAYGPELATDIGGVIRDLD